MHQETIFNTDHIVFIALNLDAKNTEIYHVEHMLDMVDQNGVADTSKICRNSIFIQFIRNKYLFINFTAETQEKARENCIKEFERISSLLCEPKKRRWFNW